MLSIHFTVVTGGENTYACALKQIQPWCSWTNVSHHVRQAADRYLLRGQDPHTDQALLDSQMPPETPDWAIVHGSNSPEMVLTLWLFFFLMLPAGRQGKQIIWKLGN